MKVIKELPNPAEQMGKQFTETNRDRDHDITIAEVIQLESFKNMTPEQATELINVIKTFTVIVYGCFNKEQPGDEVITMNTTKNKAA